GREYCIIPNDGRAASAAAGVNLPSSTRSSKEAERDHGPKLPPAPWINVVANPVAGFLASETGLGYTWTGNSQTNRLTPWSNDPVSDPPGEVVYLRDEATGVFWTATPLPLGRSMPILVRHGQGYTIFEQSSQGLAQELLLFVPVADP